MQRMQRKNKADRGSTWDFVNDLDIHEVHGFGVGYWCFGVTFDFVSQDRNDIIYNLYI